MTKLSLIVILMLSCLLSLASAQREKFGNGVVAIDSFTRPANANIYVAGEMITTTTPRWLRFMNVLRYEGTGVGGVQCAIFCVDTLLPPSGFIAWLWLFDDTSGITLSADNTPISLSTGAAVALIDIFGLGGILSNATNVGVTSSASLRWWTWRKGTKRNLYGFIEAGSSFALKHSGKVIVKLQLGSRY